MKQASKSALPPSEQDRLRRLGSFFKSYRLKAGLSVENVAQALELTPSTYISYEDGQHSMPLEDVFALTNLFNIAPEEVMDLVHDVYVQGSGSR